MTVIVDLGVSACLVYLQSTFPQWSSEDTVFNIVSTVGKEPTCFGHDCALAFWVLGPVSRRSRKVFALGKP